MVHKHQSDSLFAEHLRTVDAAATASQYPQLRGVPITWSEVQFTVIRFPEESGSDHCSARSKHDDDDSHCRCWWDGGACCACGAGQ